MTRVCTRPVYTAVYLHCMCIRPCTSRVKGCVHVYTAHTLPWTPPVYTACTRPCTRPYTGRVHGGVHDTAVYTSDNRVHTATTVYTKQQLNILECGPIPNVMAALSNIAGALCSTPQSLAGAHYSNAVQ